MGKFVRDPEELQRFKSLAIPPAWREVWICPIRNGHLQATGRDAKGRKQHRYHPRWREVRDENKYGRILAFAKALPIIREKVDNDLRLTGLPRDKILATVVRLLETSHIRVGNEEYARQNKSYGLATLRNRHVNVSGSTIRFEFRGKSGVEHALNINDRRLAKIIKRCQDLPGYELFQYLDDDGQHHTIDSSDVNEYIRQIAGEEFSTKDFRTWAGTVLAARALQQFESADSDSQSKRNIVQAVGSVAKKLGNTKAVCRKCYIHPAVIEAYTDGSLLRVLKRRVRKEITGSVNQLEPEETAVLGLFRTRLKNNLPTSNREARKTPTNGSKG
jgi:DNA topoisomerase-1